jgi:hypothetical protein
MDFIPRIFAAVSAVLFMVGIGASGGSVAHAPVTTVKMTTTTQAQPFEMPAPTTTTSVYIIPLTARCGQWWGLAIESGWTMDEMETLDYVMWKESRCDPTQHNTKRNRDKSTDVGLTQINDRSWCLPSRWYPDGYLQTVGILSTVGCEQLFDPATNLKAAKEIHDYARGQGGYGFEPWGL